MNKCIMVKNIKNALIELSKSGKRLERETTTNIIEALHSLPTIDIVHCRDCMASKVYQNDSSGVEGRFCEAFTQVRMVADDDFCSYGYDGSEE